MPSVVGRFEQAVFVRVAHRLDAIDAVATRQDTTSVERIDQDRPRGSQPQDEMPGQTDALER